MGFIATCQALIAFAMLMKDFIFKAGGVGAIIFLVAIAPLGVGAAFPCTLILATGLFILLKSLTTIKTSTQLLKADNNHYKL